MDLVQLHGHWATNDIERSEKLKECRSTYNLERSERLNGYFSTYHFERVERVNRLFSTFNLERSERLIGSLSLSVNQKYSLSFNNEYFIIDRLAKIEI